jgi:hypothetical protein
VIDLWREDGKGDVGGPGGVEAGAQRGLVGERSGEDHQHGVGLARSGARWTGLLLGAGAITYWAGGLLIFAVGPRTPLIQTLEVSGAGLFAVGFMLLSRPVAASHDPATVAAGRSGGQCESEPE